MFFVVFISYGFHSLSFQFTRFPFYLIRIRWIKETRTWHPVVVVATFFMKVCGISVYFSFSPSRSIAQISIQSVPDAFFYFREFTLIVFRCCCLLFYLFFVSVLFVLRIGVVVCYCSCLYRKMQTTNYFIFLLSPITQYTLHIQWKCIAIEKPKLVCLFIKWTMHKYANIRQMNFAWSSRARLQTETDAKYYVFARVMLLRPPQQLSLLLFFSL